MRNEPREDYRKRVDGTGLPIPPRSGLVQRRNGQVSQHRFVGEFNPILGFNIGGRRAACTTSVAPRTRVRWNGWFGEILLTGGTPSDSRNAGQRISPNGRKSCPQPLRK